MILVYKHNIGSFTENGTYIIWDTNGSSNLGQTTRPCDNQQTKIDK